MLRLTERELTYRVQGWLELRLAEDEIPIKSMQILLQWLEDLLIVHPTSPLMIVKDILNATSLRWDNKKERQSVIECISRFLDASFQHDATTAPFSDQSVLQPAEIAGTFIKDKKDIPFNGQERKIAYRTIGYLELTGCRRLSNEQIKIVSSWITEEFMQNSSFLKTLRNFLALLDNIYIPAEMKARILQQYMVSFFVRNIDPFYKGNQQVFAAIHAGVHNGLMREQRFDSYN